MKLFLHKNISGQRRVKYILVIEIFILVLFIILYVKTKNYEKSFLSCINIDNKKITWLYPISLFLLDHLKFLYLFKQSEKQKNNLKLLYVNKNIDISSRLYRCEKAATIILIVLIFNILALFATIGSMNKQILIDNKYINRPDYGEGKKDVNLNVFAEDVEGGSEKTSISINIQERKYKEEDIDQLMSKAMKYIDSSILGENKSLDKITKSLNLIQSIPNTSITIDWDLDEYGIINSDGELDNNEIKKEGILTSIKAHIKYFETEAEYEIFLNIFPKAKTKQQIFLDNLKKAIDEKSEETKTESKIELPTSIGNSKLYFSIKKESTDKKLFIMGLVIAIAIFFAMDKELENKRKKRDIQLAMDYPEIINKFVLLLGAGMTIKGAWGKITQEYSQKAREEPNYQRYAYEEMLVTWHELGVGISEMKAYENFGKRLKVIQYLKFSSLITQNLQKGSISLLNLLEFESMDAFEERKELAKRLGEEAGTKLLGPMMIMLIIVLFIIIVPAFMTLGI